MHIVFLKAYDIYKAKADYILERTLAARMCEMGLAVPYSVYLDIQAKEKAAKIKAAEAAKAKAKAKKETATSKKVAKRSKAIK